MKRYPQARPLRAVLSGRGHGRVSRRMPYHRGQRDRSSSCANRKHAFLRIRGRPRRDKARRATQYLGSDDKHVRPEIANLSAAPQHSVVAAARLLDYEQIKGVTERLRRATRVEAFGMGVSAICAELLTHRLIWLGIPIHITGTVNIARGLAHGLDASSFAIGISYEGMSEETVAFLRTARDRGAHTLAITTREKSAITEVAHEVLLLSSAGPWPEAGSARLMPSMALLSESIAECLKGHKNISSPTPHSHATS